MKPADNPGDVQIQPADPGARSRALWLLAAGLVAGGAVALASVMFEDRIDSWVNNTAVELVQHPEVFFMALFVTMLPLFAASVYVFILGGRIVKARRMPYPGQQVIKDTPVLTGEQAVQRGRVIQLIAAVMGLLSLALPFVPPLFMLYLSRGI